MDLRVDRLSLRVPGLSPDEGRRLAELVGRGLAGTQAGVGDAGALRVSVQARAGEPLDGLAGRIAEQVSSSLPRSS
jgi:hypothetical protein